MKVVSTSPQQTFKLGYDFARQLQAGEIVALIGDLGGGKTTFVQGVAAGLNIKEKITSPTFNLIKKYATPNYQYLCHIDLYRLKNDQEITEIGLEEELVNPQNFTFIEWADKIKRHLPSQRKEVTFQYLGPQTRQLKFDQHF